MRRAASAGIVCLLCAICFAESPIPGATSEKQRLDRTIEQIPAQYREAVARQLQLAAGNRDALIGAIEESPAEERVAVGFLLANMAEIDLRALPKDLLTENVIYAFKARRGSAWAAEIPEDVFLNDVLPYASVNERREKWRKDFYERFSPWVAECKSPGEAALVLNKRLFDEVKVHYHATRRPKPDQSPSESMECGYASCSGLSILLIDACRAVGVPARFVGTPAWTTGKGDANGNHAGNHTWVEIWDGQWHVLGASEVSPLDETWFLGNASKSDPTQAVNRIYASSFRRTGTHFILVWDEGIDWVAAEDVTQSYLNRASARVKVEGGSQVQVRIVLGEQLVADYADDGNGRDLILSAGQTYGAMLTKGGETRKQIFVARKEGTVAVRWEE